METYANFSQILDHIEQEDYEAAFTPRDNPTRLYYVNAVDLSKLRSYDGDEAYDYLETVRSFISYHYSRNDGVIEEVLNEMHDTYHHPEFLPDSCHAFGAFLNNVESYRELANPKTSEDRIADIHRYAIDEPPSEDHAAMRFGGFDNMDKIYRDLLAVVKEIDDEIEPDTGVDGDEEEEDPDTNDHDAAVDELLAEAGAEADEITDELTNEYLEMSCNGFVRVEPEYEFYDPGPVMEFD